jgi:hypothetical protein
MAAHYVYGKVSREALLAWLEQRGHRPDFFFQHDADGDASSEAKGVAEMNANRGIAVMALLLAERGGAYKHGEGPNAAQIEKSVIAHAERIWGNAKGLEQFRKRIRTALKEYPAGME